MRTVGTTVQVSATELHLRDKLIDIATALARVRHDSSRLPDTLEMVREKLDDTRQFEHVVSHPLWAKRQALVTILHKIQRAQKTPELEPDFLEGLE